MIRRLRDSLPETVDVEPLPDSAEELRRPATRGHLCIYFAGLSGRPQPSTSGSVELRRQLWQVMVRHRSRRRDGGLYGLLDACRLLLSGYRPQGGAGLLQLEEESAPEWLDGCWVAWLTWSCPVAILPQQDPDAAVRLVRATWENLPHDHVTTVEKPQ